MGIAYALGRRGDELDVTDVRSTNAAFLCYGAREQCDVFSTAPQAYEAGHAYYAARIFQTMMPSRSPARCAPSIRTPEE